MWRRTRRAMLVAALAWAGAGMVAVVPGGRAAAEQREQSMGEQAEAAEAPARLVLEGVPRVGKYPRQSTGAPEDHSFPGSLRGCLEFLRDDIWDQWISKYGKLTQDWHGVHEFVMGTSGIAFQLSWCPGKWDGRSWDPFAMAPDPLEFIGRAFESVGYGHEVLLTPDFARSLGLKDAATGDEGLFRRRIVESIRKGRPVIAFGTLGRGEACLLTGYDEGGRVAVGWHFCHDDKECEANGIEADPSGYSRKRNWFADTRAIVLVGEKGRRRSARETYRRALQWGLRVVRTPEVRGWASGHAAYRAWIEDLRRDADFIGLDLPALQRRRGECGATWGHIAEAHGWGAMFLAQAVEAEPAWAEELGEASRCLGAQHDMFLTVKGDGDASRYADPWFRRRLVPPIRVALRLNEEAVAHIERALAKVPAGE